MKKKKPAKEKTSPDEFLQKFSKRLKELRIEAGYSSYEYFAYECGISRTQYGNYENGSDLRLTNLKKIVDTLGVSLEEFFSDGFE